jgi:hypothetical protein
MCYLEEDCDAGLFISARQLSSSDWHEVYIEEFDRNMGRLVPDRELHRREMAELGDPNAAPDLGGGLLFDKAEVSGDLLDPLPAPVLHKVERVEDDRVIWRDVPVRISFRAVVRGVGESNFSGNGVEFDSVAAAVEHARGIFNSWGGCDAWAVIPVQVQPDQGGRWTRGSYGSMGQPGSGGAAGGSSEGGAPDG